MEKNWSKVAEGKYIFRVDGAEVGNMEIAWNSLNQKATAVMGGKTFEFKRTGLWKTVLEVTDRNGMPTARIYPEKWFAHSSVLEYRGLNYRMVLRNRPMAEYAITRDDRDVMAYGLFAEGGKTELRITGEGEDSDPFFHALLWSLFAPIAHSDMHEDFNFHFMMGL